MEERKKGSSESVQRRLEIELQRLQLKLGLPLSLKVVWIPRSYNDLSGEVQGTDIRIYEEEEEKALATLHHEVLDYLISQAIEPYKEVTNKLIKIVNDDAYHRKEKVIEALTRLIED